MEDLKRMFDESEEESKFMKNQRTKNHEVSAKRQ
jgi:hypothetical protein